jgi:hypothetical protein
MAKVRGISANSTESGKGNPQRKNPSVMEHYDGDAGPAGCADGALSTAGAAAGAGRALRCLTRS